MSEEKKDTRTAVQKLSDVENGVARLYNAFDLATKDLVTMKNAVTLLNNKVNALVEAISKGGDVNDEVIDGIMVQNNIDNLTNKVTNMVLQGILAPEDQISENSFVVGQESDDSGKVINPRIQFALKALNNTDLQAKLLGKKVGETAQFVDGGLTFKVLESYKIQPPPDASTPKAAPAVSDAPTSEASQPNAQATAAE